MTTPAATSASKDRASGQRRSAARLAAVQALYQIELSGTAPEVVLNEFLDHRLKEEVDGLRLDGADRRMLSDLVAGIAKEAHALDDMLSAVLEDDWPVERLETLLRLVLRAGAYELSERRDVPPRVVIAEYVDLADAFFGGKEPGMVNGVLDRLARSLRPEAFGAEGSSAGHKSA
jgi:N utilization substance protein B